MQLLCLIIHIYNQHISKKDILHKVILIRLFPVGGNQIPNLAYGKSSHHICFIISGTRQKNIFYFLFRNYFKEMKARQHLAFCHGCCKIHNLCMHICFNLKCCCNLLPVFVIKGKSDFGYITDFF